MNPALIIPSIGRIVHFVLPDGQHRPAVILRVWHHPSELPQPSSLVNLQVFMDGSNDHADRDPNAPLTVWQTSVHQDCETFATRTWHAPEMVDQTPLHTQH